MKKWIIVRKISLWKGFNSFLRLIEKFFNEECYRLSCFCLQKSKLIALKERNEMIIIFNMDE